ncbi:MAG TPA: hypothetical protein VH478_20930 [Trebonia sp.]|nr:hypothetical protein [Trebonia sp.]
MPAERTVDGAPQVLRRTRRLLAFYRTSEPALPSWIESFVKAGYAHYRTLLPMAFTDQEATARQVAAMLGFLFSMEGLALSLGCDRAQLELAVAQSHPQDQARTALLWAARSSWGSWPRLTCGRGATSCSPARCWCPPTRATSAASCTPWSRSRA